jgi:hypothetical protein
MAHAEACLHAGAELIRKAGRHVGYARPVVVCARPVGELIRKAGRCVEASLHAGAELIRKAGRRVGDFSSEVLLGDRGLVSSRK